MFLFYIILGLCSFYLCYNWMRQDYPGTWWPEVTAFIAFFFGLIAVLVVAMWHFWLVPWMRKGE